MGFWEDILNGGLDRNFDGKIDSKDRELYLFEEAKKAEKLQEESDRQNRESWKGYCLEESVEYDIDADEYDDEEEYLEALEEAKKEQWKNDCIGDYEFPEIDPQDYDTKEEYLEAIDECRRASKVAENENNATVTLSFSFEEPKRTKPTDGAWKYYDETWDSWHYDQALIENFPELAGEYEPNVSDNTLPDIIIETYEIDHDRTVKYLKWLWKTFTADLFVDEKDSVWGRHSYKGRGYLIYRLIAENEDSKDLYDLLKSDAEFLIAAFRDCVHEKHQYGLVRSYMMLMIANNDTVSAKLVYRCYLEGQKGRYSDKDLGNLWNDIIYNISELDFEGKDKLAIVEQLIPLITEIGVRSKKPLSSIAKKQREWKERVELEDIDEEEHSIGEELSDIEDKCSWRQKVAPSKTRYANHYEYETIEDFEKAVAIGYSEYEEKQAKNRHEGYSQEKICSFCKVDLMLSSKVLPYYLTDDLDLSIGDEVIVPYGKENKETKGIVVSIGMCYASIFPFDIKQIKTVIKKN